MRNIFTKILIYLFWAGLSTFAALIIAKFSSLGIVGLIIFIVLFWIFIQVIKEPFLGLLLIIVTLPFERIPTLDIGLVTIKLDQIFAGMTLISWLLKVIFEKRKIQPYYLGWFLVIFLFVNLISALFAFDVSRAMSVLVFTTFMMIISFVANNLIDSKEKLEKVIKLFLLVSFLICIFGFFQFAGDIIGLPPSVTLLKDIYSKVFSGYPRIHGFSMEPLYFANYLFIPLGLASGLFIFKQNQFIPLKYLFIYIIVVLITIILGISRGAYLGLAVFILFFVIFAFKQVVTFKNIIIGLLESALIAGVAYLFLNAVSHDTIDKFIRHATVEDYAESESVQKRLTDYKLAIDFWQESPVIGIGPGNYGPRYENYPPHEAVTDWEIVNNQYLETLCETGIWGLSLLILIFIVVLFVSIKTYILTKDLFLKSIILGLSAALVAILVQYNFFSTLYIMHIWVLIGLMISVYNLSKGKVG